MESVTWLTDGFHKTKNRIPPGSCDLTSFDYLCDYVKIRAYRAMLSTFEALEVNTEEVIHEISVDMWILLYVI